MKIVFVVPVFTSNALAYPFCKYRRRQLALDSKSGLQNWQPANLFWNGFCEATKKSVLILVLLAKRGQLRAVMADTSKGPSTVGFPARN